MEERVARAIRWALTEPGKVLRGNEPGSTGGRVGKLRADHPGSVSARCMFCGSPGTRLCCDCDDLPALDYLQ